jgi:GH24 family phage-related lysozyme (muramidase)
MSDAIKKPFVDAAHAIQDMHKQVQASGGYLRSLGTIAGPVGDVARLAVRGYDAYQNIAGSLATMVAKFEGHAKNGYGVYRDIAGNLTAGFGHLVRKGEDFSHLDKAGAMALLAKDLGAAVSTVSKMVKVHLSHNQADALADFVFNLGGDKFSRSTLLKKLNSGDFAGAADQFQYWNKAMNHGHLVVNSGLSARRSAEADLFRAPDKTTTITQHADIHVEGVKDPHEAGRAAGDATSHAFSGMLRNMKEAAS